MCSVLNYTHCEGNPKSRSKSKNTKLRVKHKDEEHLRKQLEEKNEYDLELYQYAKMLCLQQLRTYQLPLPSPQIVEATEADYQTLLEADYKRDMRRVAAKIRAFI